MKISISPNEPFLSSNISLRAVIPKRALDKVELILIGDYVENKSYQWVLFSAYDYTAFLATNGRQQDVFQFFLPGEEMLGEGFGISYIPDNYYLVRLT